LSQDVSLEKEETQHQDIYLCGFSFFFIGYFCSNVRGNDLEKTAARIAGDVFVKTNGIQTLRVLADEIGSRLRGSKVTCPRSMYHLKSEIFKHSGLWRRRLIGQRTVGPMLVIFAPPIFYYHPGQKGPRPQWAEPPSDFGLPNQLGTTRCPQFKIAAGITCLEVRNILGRHVNQTRGQVP